MAVLDAPGATGFRSFQAQDYGCAGRGLFDPSAKTAGKQLDDADRAFYSWKKCYQCIGVDAISDYDYDLDNDSCGNAKLFS